MDLNGVLLEPVLGVIGQKQENTLYKFIVGLLNLDGAVYEKYLTAHVSSRLKIITNMTFTKLVFSNCLESQ